LVFVGSGALPVVSSDSQLVTVKFQVIIRVCMNSGTSQATITNGVLAQEKFIKFVILYVFVLTTTKTRHKKHKNIKKIKKL